MIVGILFIICVLLIIGSIIYSQKVRRREKSDAVFGNPDRAAGGWYWIIAGVSSLMLLWFYFSWDAARSFFPNAANELCQVAKVAYAINPTRSIFPIDSPVLKGTYLLARDTAHLQRIEQQVGRSSFDQSERAQLLQTISEIRSALLILTSSQYVTSKTFAELNTIAVEIEQLTAHFESSGYPGLATTEEEEAVRAQPKWGEIGIEIPFLPVTERGRKFDAASYTIGDISKRFVKIRNKSPHFEKQVTKVKNQIETFQDYSDNVIGLEQSVVAERAKLIKQINQVFKRIDDATIFPPLALDPVERAIRNFDQAQFNAQDNLRYISIFALPGGSIMASAHACSEQGAGRWLPKPADTVRNFLRIMNPAVGYKNVPMLWYEKKQVGKIIAPVIPDWIANLVPGEYPRHSEAGDVPHNFKSKVLNFARGNYRSPALPVPTGHIWDSLVRVFLGLILGVVCGVPLGIFMGLSRFAKGYFDPMIELYRPVPPLAWAPLILTIFGIGDGGKVFLLFMVAFAIMVISARAGATGTQLSKIHAAHSLGASKIQIIRGVILPNSLPEILTGVRVAVGVCWGTLVAAEFLAGTTGIGFVENVARKQSHYEIIWVTIVVLGVLGLIMDLIMRWIIARTIPWRGKG